MTTKKAWLWIGLHALLAAGALVLVLHLRSDVRPNVFLAASDPVRVSQEEFLQRFGSDAFVVATCRGDGSESFRGRVGELARALGEVPGVGAVEVPKVDSPLARELSLADAAGKRLTLLVPLDGTSDGALGAVTRVADRFADLDVGLAGQPVLNRALQEASDKVGQRLFPLLALAMALLLWLAYRSTRVVGAVLATTVCALLYGMAVVALLDSPVNLITILLPVLLLALTVALCIHLVNSYRLKRAAGRRIESALRAMRRDELRPCLVTTLTTAAGFGSFAFSRIDPLRVLGIAMAVSILAAFATAFTLLPAILRLARPQPREGLQLGAALMRWVPRIVARPRWILAGSALVVAAGVLAAPGVSRETNGLNYLPARHPLRKESERLGAEGVGTASLELLLHAGPDQPLADLAGPLREIEQRLSALGAPVRGIVTPLTIGREAAWRLGLPAVAGMALADGAGPLESRLRPFRDTRDRIARISLRIDPVDDPTYRLLCSRIDAIVATALCDAKGARAEWSGEYPIIMTVQSELLRTLLESLVMTTLVILTVLAVAQRSLRQALLTLVPALLPLAFVVIACSLAGIPISIATVMVLSVTLGIVTDDSVHMLHAFERHPLDESLRRVGTAVTETSIAIFFGFAVLGGADFLPTRHFGLLTAGAMIVALVADLIVFPVLLRGAGVQSGQRQAPPRIPLLATRKASS